MDGRTPPAVRRILVVSEARSAAAIAHTLRSLGEVVLCDSAGRALAALAEAPFDCIVSAMLLPDMHATALLEALRQRGIETPVLVLTEPSSIEDTVEAMRAGAHHVVEAPPYAATLRERVARLLR